MSLLISLLVILVIAGIIAYILDLIVPAPYAVPARLILAVLVLVWLVGALTGHAPVIRIG